MQVSLHHNHLKTFILELHIAPGFRWKNNDYEYSFFFSFIITKERAIFLFI